MAIPTPFAGATTSWTKTTDTFKRDVDAKLWAALMAKSPILDMLARPKIGNYKFEWETDVAPTRVYAGNATLGALASSTSGTTFDLAAAPADLQIGSLIRNASIATPVGSYGQDEVMEVTNVSSATVTVVRGVNSAGTGSNAHANSHNFEVIYAPVQEGSSPSVNKYKDVVLVSNYANSVDFYLTVTGDQAAIERLVPGDTLDNQFQKNLRNLNNQLEGMLFYGKQNSTPQGSASLIRRTQGLDDFLASASAQYDIATMDVTPAALDGLFYKIMAAGTDPADRFIIACHPQQARKVSAFGIDKVRLGQQETKYGRYIDTYKSDLGIEAPVLWSLNVSKSDLFIINMDKISMPCFRPFEQAKWDYQVDGIDAFRQRYLGSFGVKVVDALYSHAKLGKLPWT